MSTVADIERAIKHLDVKQQVELIRKLPKYLKISFEDVAWLQLAEVSFNFWDNPDDAIYDTL